jgi:2-dehydropantoate 2-reductase
MLMLKLKNVHTDDARVRSICYNDKRNEVGKMRIGIIGAGAIGMLVGAYLKEKHVEVTLYTRREEQAKALRQNGLTCIKKGKINHYPIHAVSMEEGISNEEIVLVAVKQYHIQDIQDHLLAMKCQTVLFLQNGMGHVPFLATLSQTNIGIGIVEHGAYKHNDTTVEHTGIGSVKVGVLTGSLHMLLRYHDEQFPLVYEENWQEIVQRKLMVNAVINPLTALYGVRNGGLLENDHYRFVMRQLFDEVFRVIGSDNKEDYWQHICMICEQTMVNRSSMLRDIDQGHQTEIEAILGYIINEAKKKDISIPVTVCIYYSIKGLERNNKMSCDVRRKEVFLDAN